MLKKITIGFALVLISFISINVSAQELKIGFVNPQSVLDRMPETKAVQQKLKNFADRKALELQQKDQEFQNAVAAYEQKKDVISAQAKEAEEQKLQQMGQELSKAEQTAQVELQAKRAELLGPLQTQIADAISAVATREGLAFVLNTVTSTGDFIILYASEEYASKYNITDKVMIELGI